ncbi:HNH endonuclease [Ferrimonas balearica]|uniref:HNH endonuclease signature motif containing protein n=1 Tax=Ferrimonas balearica TaxID=44012 RepID=UPI001C5A37B3|nr:HNH endonuclease [Ferrimonas balearica]MBW3164916.1 HNH endonuclease [Ferrimonas balearica]
MAGQKTNKHGLSRTIPSAIKQVIRSEAGYGCVFCGSPFVDYEHIEPEFNNAKEHDPAKMTILCGACHDSVTSKRRSKRKVWEAKQNPKAKQQGFVRQILEPTEDHATISIGNCNFDLASVVFEVNFKPMVWFERPRNEGEPILLNAIFYDENGQPLAFINRNAFTGIVAGSDIKGVGTRLEVRTRPREISLVLDSKGDQPIKIQRLKNSYGGYSIDVDAKGVMKFGQGGQEMVFNDVNLVGFDFGFSFGGVPRTRRDEIGILSKMTIAMMIDKAGAWPITSYTGTKIAWWLGSVLVSKDYEFIAQVSPAREVSDLQDEFIGKLVRSGKSMMLSYHDDTYENGEPIWLSAGNLDSRMCQIDGLYDLGYRLGSREQCYRPDIFNRPDVEPLEQKGAPPPLTAPNKLRKTSPVKLGDLVNIDFEGS